MINVILDQWQEKNINVFLSYIYISIFLTDIQLNLGNPPSIYFTRALNLGFVSVGKAKLHLNYFQLSEIIQFSKFCISVLQNLRIQKIISRKSYTATSSLHQNHKLITIFLHLTNFHRHLKSTVASSLPFNFFLKMTIFEVTDNAIFLNILKKTGYLVNFSHYPWVPDPKGPTPGYDFRQPARKLPYLQGRTRAHTLKSCR